MVIRRRGFRPSDPRPLETRIVPSGVGAAAVVSPTLAATFRGAYTAITSEGPGVATSTERLTGSSRVAGVGPVALSGAFNEIALRFGLGDLSSGTVTLIAGRKGTAVLNIAQQGVALAGNSLAFTVSAATGSFAGLTTGRPGTAVLTTLQVGRATSSPFGLKSHGRFALTLALTPTATSSSQSG